MNYTFVKTLKWIVITIVIFYSAVCSFLFFSQESIIFFPKKLSQDYVYQFEHEFEEITINASDGIKLNALLFKATSKKGLIFYLHGNAGALDSWGHAADGYLDLNYDFFILDYRSYGKSEGKIKSEKQFFEDVQSSYDFMLQRYDEANIIIAGYSIGTAPATKLASDNNPKLLILQAPFYNLTEMALSQYPFIPTAILKYKFETSHFITSVKCPILIFHGQDDSLIPVSHSLKLKELLKPNDKLFILPGLGHNGMNTDLNYHKQLKNAIRD